MQSLQTCDTYSTQGRKISPIQSKQVGWWKVLETPQNTQYFRSLFYERGNVIHSEKIVKRKYQEYKNRVRIDLCFLKWRVDRWRLWKQSCFLYPTRKIRYTVSIFKVTLLALTFVMCGSFRLKGVTKDGNVAIGDEETGRRLLMKSRVVYKIERNPKNTTIDKFKSFSVAIYNRSDRTTGTK